jgi:uncharacterized protein
MNATRAAKGPEEPSYWQPPYAQWVVKASKLCNLRCTYCYEYPNLADVSRMSPDQLAAMFSHIAERYERTGRTMDFVWHGGEPLMHELEYFDRIGELQRSIFGSHAVPYTNSIQTNLTILTEPILERFKTFFQNVGVSIDLFGNQRVNIAGRPSEESVLTNMQRLKDEGILFGCITVLSQATAPHVEQIYRFFEDIDTSFRLLPIYRTGFPGQQGRHALTPAEIVRVFQDVVDIWLSSTSTIHVLPIEDYIGHVVRFLSAGTASPRFYNKLEAEVVYIVDTDGSLYSNADAYDLSLSHGNVFEQSLREMEASARYRNAVAAAHERMSLTCSTCKFHGACSGYFMAEATPEQRWLNAHGSLHCAVVKPIQEYILGRLSESCRVADEVFSVRDRIENRLRELRKRPRAEATILT